MNEVLNCLETRRSCRAYRPEQVPEEALQEILRAGLYAPSGMGRQSVKLLVVQDPAAIAALERLNGGVLGNPDAHPFYGAPTVCVVAPSTYSNPWASALPTTKASTWLSFPAWPSTTAAIGLGAARVTTTASWSISLTVIR